MKKIITLFMMSLFVLGLFGCGKLNFTEKNYEELAIIRIQDKKSISFLPDEEMKMQLSGPFEKVKNETENHLYLVNLTKENNIVESFYINSEESITYKGKQYISSEKAEKPFDFSEWIKKIDEEIDKADLNVETRQIKNTLYPQVLVKSPPKKMDGSEKATEKEKCLETGMWIYYIGEMVVDGAPSAVLWREAKEENLIEMVCSVPHPDKKNTKNIITYVEDSYEKSNKTNIYFSVTCGMTHERSLWSYDIEKEQTAWVMYYPCSNMIVTDIPENGTTGIGWIIQSSTLMAIDLEKKTENFDLSRNMRSTIEEPFFTEEEGKIETVNISEKQEGILLVEVLERDKDATKDEQKYLYEINLAHYTIDNLLD